MVQALSFDITYIDAWTYFLSDFRIDNKKKKILMRG